MRRVVPRGARVLGVCASRSATSTSSRNVQTARDAGAQTTNLTFAWDDVERPYDAGLPTRGRRGRRRDDGDGAAPPTPTQLFNPLLHVANLVLPDERMGATLTLDALDVGGSRAPAELATRALDDAELGARYDRLTDYALDQLPDVERHGAVLREQRRRAARRRPRQARRVRRVRHACGGARPRRCGRS